MFDISQFRGHAVLIAGACILAATVIGDADSRAAIAQLGERQTEDLKVPGSIPGLGIISRNVFTERRRKCDRAVHGSACAEQKK